MSERLETMRPTPTFDAEAHAETVATWATLADDDAVSVKVWGGDWCGDCRGALPDFAAALAAAGFDLDDVEHYPVEKEDDGTKVGPRVEEYGVEYIPTIVVERDGEELARFVEAEALPAAVYLAERLREADAEAGAEA